MCTPCWRPASPLTKGTITEDTCVHIWSCCGNVRWSTLSQRQCGKGYTLHFVHMQPQNNSIITFRKKICYNTLRYWHISCGKSVSLAFYLLAGLKRDNSGIGLPPRLRLWFLYWTMGLSVTPDLRSGSRVSDQCMVSTVSCHLMGGMMAHSQMLSQVLCVPQIKYSYSLCWIITTIFGKMAVSCILSCSTPRRFLGDIFMWVYFTKICSMVYCRYVALVVQ